MSDSDFLFKSQTSHKSNSDDDEFIVITSPTTHTVLISIFKCDLEKSYDEPILNKLILHHSQKNPAVLRNGFENKLYEHYVMPNDAVVELQLVGEDPGLGILAWKLRILLIVILGIFIWFYRRMH